MTNAISQTQLDTSLQKVKTYVDAQANANVYRTETLLYTGSSAMPTSGTITLNQSMDDFDALRFVIGATSEAVDANTLVNTVTYELTKDEITKSMLFNMLIPCSVSNVKINNANASLNQSVLVRLSKSSSTTFTIQSHTNSFFNGSASTVLYRVYGIKYVPKENYSTTEQIVGKWIDGSNVYMRTFTGNMPAVSRGQGGQINLGSGPKTILDWGGDFHIRNASGGAVVRSAGCDISFYGASSDGGPYSVWTSGLYIGQSGNLMAVFRSPEATKGDQATTSDTYNFWVKYTK